MTMSINTNSSALFALQALTSTNRGLDITRNRISTGRKVNSAADNAAVYAIAQKQRGELAGYKAVKTSLGQAKSSINVAMAAAEAVSDLLIQLKEKATAAADPGADSAQRAAYNTEFQELVKQIGTVTDNAKFNGINAVKSGGNNISALVALPTGSNAASAYSITVTAVDIGATGLSLTGKTVTAAGGASVALKTISAASTKVNNFLAKIGAARTRIGIQEKFVTRLSDAIEVGVGNLVDANMSREATRLRALQAKQQLGLQALSIANQAPSSIIALLR